MCIDCIYLKAVGCDLIKHFCVVMNKEIEDPVHCGCSEEQKNNIPEDEIREYIVRTIDRQKFSAAQACAREYLEELFEREEASDPLKMGDYYYCESCGLHIEAGDTYCSTCGKKQEWNGIEHEETNNKRDIEL